MNAVLAYELIKLESIITAELPKVQSNSLLPQQVEEIKHALQEEADRIRNAFIHEIFGIQSEYHLERYIQFHQQELIRLIDALMEEDRELKSSKANSSQFNELYQSAFHILQSLLEFIERHFTKYFDQDTKAPFSYISMVTSDLVKWYSDIHQQLKSIAADNALTDLLLSPVKKLIELIPNGPISYRMIIYAKEIHKEAQRILKAASTSGNVNEEIRRSLIYLNFNTLKYFNFFADCFLVSINQLDSPAERIEKLSYDLKVISQAQVKPGVGLNNTMRSLKEQVIDWISEEISYLEKVTKLRERSVMLATDQEEGFKLKMEMSVSQIAYVLRIFVETRLIHNKNISELIRFFAKFFQAKRLDSISYESLRVRYYNVEEGTRKSVRALLLQLVDHINKT
jgi:vacuolar-type H+-ATPase subunit E/Vma4